MVGNAASVFGSPGVRQRMPSRKEVSERSRDRGARAHVPPQSEKDGTTRGTLARYVAQPAPWELKIGPFVTFGGALRVRRASISQSAKDSTSQELHQRWFTIRRQRAAPTLDHDTTSKELDHDTTSQELHQRSITIRRQRSCTSVGSRYDVEGASCCTSAKDTKAIPRSSSDKCDIPDDLGYIRRWTILAPGRFRV